MTTQLLSAAPAKGNTVKSLTRANHPSPVAKSEKIEARSSNSERLERLVQSYPVLHQVKYLHLEADIEVLLQQLQTLRN